MVDGGRVHRYISRIAGVVEVLVAMGKMNLIS